MTIPAQDVYFPLLENPMMFSPFVVGYSPFSTFTNSHFLLLDTTDFLLLDGTFFLLLGN